MKQIKMGGAHPQRINNQIKINQMTTEEKNGYMVVVEERKAGGEYVEIKNRFFLHFRHAYHYVQTCAELFLDDSNEILITNDVKKAIDTGEAMTWADVRTSPYLITIKRGSVYGA